MTPPIPWHEDELCIFDIETGGVNRDYDRLLTATAGRVPLVGEPKIFEWTANPGIEIHPDATAVNGLTNEHIREHGRPSEEVISELVATLEEVLLTPANPIPLVIYNAVFDLTFLDREARRCGVVPLLDRLGSRPLFVIDPMVIDKAINPFVKGNGQRRLTPTCARYGIELAEADAHNATADATATGALARRLPIHQSGDDFAVRARRDQLKRATPADLMIWQKFWRRRDSLSLADWFRRQGNAVVAADIAREASFWPIIGFGELEPTPPAIVD